MCYEWGYRGMENESKDKVKRCLDIYTRLQDGYVINKSIEAQRYGVNERSIQRDIDDIRNYLADDSDRLGYTNTIIYDRTAGGFRLEQIYRLKLDNSEILAVCKILLESRAFTKKEMKQILHKLVDCCVPESNRQMVYELIKNEEYHYIEPHHKSVFIDKMWEIGKAIREKKYIEVEYQRLKGHECVKRRLMPLAIMFSEYYFYITAFIDNDEVKEDFDVLNDAFPTIYRIDRIKKLNVLDECYHVPYKNRFEEGEFRKRIQFMFGGKLRKVKFRYTGLSIEAVLDRLPTAEAEEQQDGTWIVTAEVFGDGIDMWLRSQGKLVGVIK